MKPPAQPVSLEPALALVEFDSIAAGIVAADAMVKKAPIARIVTGTVQPGKYLVMIVGGVGPVQESLAAGLDAGASSVVDHLLLPGVHPDVPESIAAARHPQPADALGIVETTSVAAAIRAADAGLKGAQVTLLELRLADGLGGKGLAFFTGAVTDVEAAVEAGCAAIFDNGRLLNAVVIPQLHAEIAENIAVATRFRVRAGSL
jgi:microcompartment protein CcmL/EutN